MGKHFSTRVSLGVLLTAAFATPAWATDTTISGTDNTQHTLTGTDTLTVTDTGDLDVVLTSGIPVLVNSGASDVSITNHGSIYGHYAFSAPGNVPGVAIAAPSGATVTIDNYGSIEGAALAIAAGNGAHVEITNQGDIIGHYTNSPVISGFNTTAIILSSGDDTFTNYSDVTGAVFMGLGDDTVNILTGSHITGTIYGDDGSLSVGPQDPTSAQIDAEGGAINFIGSINTKTSEQEVGSLTGPGYASYLFRDVHFESGYWTLSADVQGRVFTIDPGATVELHDSDARYNEFVVWHDPGESLVNLVNNGHMIFYNDLTTYSTDDGLNYNIGGTGSLDLYNTAGSTGVFYFGATGGFGDGLNLHGGTVLIGADYTGDITVFDGGILRIGGNLVHSDPNDARVLTLEAGGGTTGNVDGHVTINGELIFDRSDDFTFTADISGAGLIVKEGAGVATLSGTFNYSGDMEIHGGTVQLTGSVTNDGTTSVGDAAFYVNGDVTSDVAVNDGGQLSGSGDITGDVSVEEGGVVAPGNSPGTLHIAGDFTFKTGSIYAAQTQPNGAGDSIEITGGAATIESGVALEVTNYGPSTNYAPQTEYTILSAENGINGTFATLSTDLAFLDPTLSYLSNSVVLTLTRNDLDFSTFASNPNEASTGDALEQLGSDDPLYLAMLNLTEEQSSDALADLSGEAFGTGLGASINGALQFGGQVGDHLMQVSQAPSYVQVASLDSDVPLSSSSQGGRFWAEGYGAGGKFDGDANAAAYDDRRAGLALGWDSAVHNGAMIGAAIGYGSGRLSVDSLSSHADTDFTDASVYGGFRTGAFVVRGSLGYSWRSTDSTRHVVTPVSETLKASYDSRAVNLEAELARPFALRRAYVEPFLGLGYVRLESDGFTETGGSAALTAADADADVAFATLGVRGGRELGASANAPSLSGSIAWRHAEGDIIPRTSMAFASNPGVSFSVAGAPIADDVLSLGAKINFVLSNSARLSLGYEGELSEDAQQHGARARLSWRF